MLGALALGSLALGLFHFFPATAANINNFIYDFFLTSMDLEDSDSKVAIIDIDEASLKEFGQLPWPRSIIADLVTMLLNSGASAIGLDIWMTEQDRSSPVVVDSLLEKGFGLNLDLAGIPPLAQDNDRYLRGIIAGKPVALGAYANYDESGKQTSWLPPGAEITTPAGKEGLKDFVKKASGLIPPLPLLSSAAPAGIMSLYPDSDGVVRSIPLLTRAGDTIYPALSLSTLMEALGQKEIGLIGAKGGLEELKLGKLDIPVEKDSSFRLVYRGKGHSLPFYSAADILEGRIGRELLVGKILFIGSSAHTLNDLRSTPFDPEAPSVEMHATAADNILSGSSIRFPLWGKTALTALAYAASACAAASFAFLSIHAGVILMILLAGGLFWTSWLFFLSGLFLPPAAPLAAILLAGVFIIPWRYWREQKERQKLQLAFGRYVAPEIVARITGSGEQLLKGEQKQITVMFSDLRNFTSISEKLAPPQLVRLLNHYFTPMTACIVRHQGTLDKFIGDALMAFWNAPLDLKDHSLRAVNAALRMQSALADMRPEIKKEYGIDLYMGIGLSAGAAHVGNMGSNELLDYTCIGETVNLASRLEGLCKLYGVGIVAGSSVRSACGPDLDFLELDVVSVKGSAKPIKIYTPLGPDAKLDEKERKIWSEALSNYFAADFDRARRGFEAASEAPFLKYASALFIRRCAELAASGAPGWDGVWKYTQK